MMNFLKSLSKGERIVVAASLSVLFAIIGFAATGAAFLLALNGYGA